MLRVPRSITGDPAHDYSSDDAPGHNQRRTSAGVAGREPEAPEVRRKRTEAFKIHIMVLLSAQRSLKAEDCFSPTEAKAYVFFVSRVCVYSHGTGDCRKESVSE